jgi:hypothetical protein
MTPYGTKDQNYGSGNFAADNEEVIVAIKFGTCVRKISARIPTIFTEVFVAFFGTSRQMPRCYLGHYRFLPNLFQLTNKPTKP